MLSEHMRTTVRQCSPSNIIVYVCVCVCVMQEVVLSPVQNNDNKPHIDSNKSNNYTMVKEVSFLS